MLISELELIPHFVSGASRLTRTLLGGVLLGLIWLCPIHSRAEVGPDFNREVRPILSQYCFKCHGPDEAARQSGLRLDSQQRLWRPPIPGWQRWCRATRSRANWYEGSSPRTSSR
jgi:hypothetical protein